MSSCWPSLYFTLGKSSHIVFYSSEWDISQKKCILYPPRAPCLQSSDLSLHIHLQSSLWNAPTLTFWRAFSVHIQSAGGPVRSACWFIQPTEKAAIKGRESAACWLGRNKNTPFHSWMGFFFLNQPFPLYCCPTSSHFHSTERTKMCRSPGLRLVCVCFFHLNPEATLTEFGQDYDAHLANRGEDLDRDWRVNLSLQQSGVKWKNFWGMCFTHVLRVPDEWNLTQDSAIFIRRYQNSPDDNKLVLVSCWFVLYSVI